MTLIAPAAAGAMSRASAADEAAAGPASEVTVRLPDLAGIGAVDDGALIETMRVWAEARRVVDAGLARLAGEVKARSSLELGYDGLAQRTGARTADALVSAVTGTSTPEARTMVAVGSMLSSPAPWLTEVASLVDAGELSVGAAAAIEQGLGAPSGTVAADDLADTAHLLTEEAKKLPPEKVASLARTLRDELDAESVADREAARFEKRFLRLTPMSNGMTRISGQADPESAALLKSAIDAVTSPRRGGPRFVDPAEKARAQGIIDDPRTTDQLAFDAVIEMVRIAGAADDGRVFGVRKPGVRVHAKLADLDQRRAAGRDTGFGWIEGETASVSLATVERRMCADGYLPILFDDNDCALNRGRSARLFNESQRVVLAAIWGGCAVEDCERPPSWTEAHHIEEWVRDQGETNISTGILLCRHHHMLLHNNGWRILVSGGPGTELTMVPPKSDAVVGPIRLVSKNPLRRRP